MTKDVLITIKGIQVTEDDTDTTELFTTGKYYKENDSYFITYQDSETTGFEGCTTTLKVDGNDRVTMSREGDVQTHLIIEKKERNIGQYNLGGMELLIGVLAKELESELDDDGGKLHVSYLLDINSSLVSENEIFVTVNPNVKA